MLFVSLGKGKFAIIDDDEVQRVLQYKWHCTSDGYAASDSERNGRGSTPIYMHRLILDAPAGKRVDHINGDCLDNRKENLRLATHAENLRNRPKSRNNSTGYKGVHRMRTKWRTQITIDGKKQHLGSFINKEDAARAYDAAARISHGEFARLNFPDETA